MHAARSWRPKRPLVVTFGCLAYLAGTALAHSWQLAAWWSVGLLAPVILRRRQDSLAFICIAACCFGLGLSRGSVVQRQFAEYQALALHKIVLTGRVTDDAVYGVRSQLTFGVDHVRVIVPRKVALPGQITVAGFGGGSVYRGDTVQVSGKPYPTRGNASASISFAGIRVLSRGSSPIDAFRRRFAAGVQSALPEPEASFGLGLLIGQRSTLPADTSQVLLMVGLTHLIAVSGYNVTIIIEAARRLFFKRSKFQTAAGCLGLITVFLLITGSSPSIVRASIISTLSILLWYYGRSMKPYVLLLVAAAITAAASPQYVWGNISWYLSFLAFFGVLVLAPLVTKRLFGIKKPKLIVQIVIESICAEVMTLPYVLHVFGQMSFAALPANALVATVVPLAMLLCLVAGLAGMWLPALAGWLAWPAKFLLTYMLGAAGMLSRIPHVFVQQVGFSFTQMLLTYGLVANAWFLLHRRLTKDAIITDKNRIDLGKGEAGDERTFQVVDN